MIYEEPPITLQVDNVEAYNMTGKLNREEGLTAGPSSGMNVAAVCKALETGAIPDEVGNVVVVVLCDPIWKYTSSVEFVSGWAMCRAAISTQHYIEYREATCRKIVYKLTWPKHSGKR